MLAKLILIFATIFCLTIYAQDSTTSITTTDTLSIKLDSLKQQITKIDSLYAQLLKQSYNETIIFEEINKIKNLKNNAARLKKEAYNYALTNKSDSSTLLLRAKALYLQATADSSNLQSKFPISTETCFKLEKLQKSAKIIKAAGVLQLLTGTTSFIFTIVDANMIEKIETETPIINSKGVTTSIKKTTTTIKHKWTMSHTTSTILSSGLIISGIITINF